MIRRSSTTVLFLVLTLLIVFGGCAKRPSVTTVSAPAPTAPAPTPAPPTPTPAPTAAVSPAPVPVAASPPTSPEEFMPNDALKPVHFDFDKSDIRKQDAEILTASARWLSDNPNHLVLVEGHTDQRGTNEYNLALGERRARAAQNFLVAHGVAASRVTVVSYGEERPLCHDETETCWAQNRRAMFLTKPR